MDQSLKNERGVSLIEISLAVIIIAVTAILILAFSRSSFSMIKDARSSDAAYLSAQEKLSQLAAKPFPDSTGSDKDTIDKIILDRSWVIKDTNTIKRAIVTVTFRTLNGNNKSITLSGAIN